MNQKIIIHGLVYEITSAQNGEILAWLTGKENSSSNELKIPDFISIDGQDYKVVIDEDDLEILSDMESISIEDSNPCYKMHGDCMYSNDMRCLYWVSPKVKTYQMPESVIWYSPYAFQSAKSLEKLTFSPALGRIYPLDLNHCIHLESIIIPEGVEEIEAEAFENCESIKTIIFPKSLIAINEHAFAKCKNLTSILFQNGLERILDEAFRETRIERIVLPDSLMSLGDRVFANCHYLKEVHLSDNLHAIGDAAFWDCVSLEEISIPAAIVKIGKEAFAHCKNLVNFIVDEKNQSYSGNDMGLFDKEKTILFRASNRKLLVFPKTLTQMEYMAFSNGDQYYDKIESIEISNRIAVDNSKHSLSAIPTLKSIIVGREASDLISLDGVLYSADLKQLIFCPPKKFQVIIPEGIEEITDRAFQNSKIRSLKLPDSVKRIGTAAFSSCRNLHFISLPASLTSMGESCFDGCENLQLATLPENINEIEYRTFFRCREINSNAIFQSLNDISTCGFQGCGFTDLRIPGNVKTIGRDAFKACANLKSVFIEEGVEVITHGAFCNNHELRSIHLPSSIKVLGNGSFACCENLESITISSLIPPKPDYDGEHVRFFSEELYPRLILYVPEEGIEAYKKHSLWGKIQNILPLTDLSLIVED